MKKLLLATLAATATLASLPAAAQFQKPEDAIKYRQSAFTVMGAHFGRIGAMANGRVPFDAKAVTDNMVIVNDMARLPFTAFGAGTDKGMPNRAKAEIWTDAAGFEAAGAAYGKGFAAVKAATDDASFKAAFNEFGGSCKGCHEKFRRPKE